VITPVPVIPPAPIVPPIIAPLSTVSIPPARPQKPRSACPANPRISMPVKAFASYLVLPAAGAQSAAPSTGRFHHSP
jgi:hypothetical protein